MNYDRYIPICDGEDVFEGYWLGTNVDIKETSTLHIQDNPNPVHYCLRCSTKNEDGSLKTLKLT